jgi:hypothetical protein
MGHSGQEYRLHRGPEPTLRQGTVEVVVQRTRCRCSGDVVVQRSGSSPQRQLQFLKDPGILLHLQSGQEGLGHHEPRVPGIPSRGENLTQGPRRRVPG